MKVSIPTQSPYLFDGTATLSLANVSQVVLNRAMTFLQTGVITTMRGEANQVLEIINAHQMFPTYVSMRDGLCIVTSYHSINIHYPYRYSTRLTSDTIKWMQLTAAAICPGIEQIKDPNQWYVLSWVFSNVDRKKVQALKKVIIKNVWAKQNINIHDDPARRSTIEFFNQLLITSGRKAKSTIR